MKEEQISIAAQILTAMKDAAKKLEEAVKKEDSDEIISIKKEIIDLQRKFGELI